MSIFRTPATIQQIILQTPPVSLINIPDVPRESSPLSARPHATGALALVRALEDRVIVSDRTVAAITDNFTVLEHCVKEDREIPEVMMRAMTVLHLLSGQAGIERNYSLAGDLLMAGQSLQTIEDIHKQDCLSGTIEYSWPLLLTHARKSVVAKFLADVLRHKSFADTDARTWVLKQFSALYIRQDFSSLQKDIEIAKIIQAMVRNGFVQDAQVLLNALNENDLFYGVVTMLTTRAPDTYRENGDHIEIHFNPARAGSGMWSGVWSHLQRTMQSAFGKLIDNEDVARMFSREAVAVFTDAMKTEDIDVKLRNARILEALASLKRGDSGQYLFEGVCQDLFEMGLAITYNENQYRIDLKNKKIPDQLVVVEQDSKPSSSTRATSTALATIQKNDDDDGLNPSPAQVFCDAIREQLDQGLVSNAFLLVVGLVLQKSSENTKLLKAIFTSLNKDEIDAILTGALNPSTAARFMCDIFAPENDETYFVMRLQMVLALTRLPENKSQSVQSLDLTSLFKILLTKGKHDVLREILSLAMSVCSLENMKKLNRVFASVRKDLGESEDMLLFVVTPLHKQKKSTQVDHEQNQIDQHIQDCKSVFQLLSELGHTNENIRGTTLVKIAFAIQANQLKADIIARLMPAFIAVMKDKNVSGKFKMDAIKALSKVANNNIHLKPHKAEIKRLEKQYGSPALMLYWYGVERLKQTVKTGDTGAGQALRKLIVMKDLQNVDLQDYSDILRESDLAGVDIRGSKLPMDVNGIRFYGAKLDRTQVTHIKHFGGSLDGANLSGVDLSGLDLRGTEFPDDINGFNFDEAQLDLAQVQHIIFRQHELGKAKLRGLDFSTLRTEDYKRDFKAYLDSTQALILLKRGRNLTNANLQGESLEGIEDLNWLTKINRTGVKLGRREALWLYQHRHALSKINLQGADLSNFEFRDGNFSGADLSGANLTMTRFHHCELDGTNFSGANTTGMHIEKKPAEVSRRDYSDYYYS